MSVAFAAFAVSMTMAAVLTPLVRRMALRGGAVDHAITSRKVHRRPVPRVGGLAIVGAFYVTLLVLLSSDGIPWSASADTRRAAGLVIGGLVIAALGLYDDLRGVRARHKLAVQVAVAVLVWWLGFRIDQIANPFGPALELGVFGLPFTVLWITGVVNAMNLIDGLDGLAAGIALIAISTTLTVGVLHNQALLVLLAAALAGAVLGFLFYNFNPASIFMGDTGSMFLGFVLATTAIQAHQKSSAAVALLVPVVALALPIGDTLLAMGRRAVRGAPLFCPDREHVHHRLLALGLSHRQAVLTLYVAALILAVAAVTLATAPGWTSALAVVLALTAAVAFSLRRLGYLRLEEAPQVLDTRRKNLEMRSRIRSIGRALCNAAGPTDVWLQLREAAPALGADCVGLTLPTKERGGKRGRLDFSHGFDEAGPACLRARYSLLGERPANGGIELGWTDGRGTVDRDTEIAVELLCAFIAAAVERMENVRLEKVGGSTAPLRVAQADRQEV